MAEDLKRFYPLTRAIEVALADARLKLTKTENHPRNLGITPALALARAISDAGYVDLKLHVVMANDFPEAVFSDEVAATAYCREKDKDPDHGVGGRATRIYWRTYTFDVDAKKPPRVVA